MHRSKHPTEKTVLIVSDFPILSEVESDISYSAASNLNLLGSLAKVGIKQSDIHTTYLSYERPEKDNFDFNQFFSKHKNIDIISNWTKIEHEKDVYVSNEFYSNVLGLLDEIKKVNPRIIVITGKWSLFFLSGIVKYSSTQGNFKSAKPLGGLNKYRASIVKFNTQFNEYNPYCLLFPILPPATKQREPAKIPIINLDYKKLGFIYSTYKETNSLDTFLKPDKTTIIGTSLEICKQELNSIIEILNQESVYVSVDIETRQSTIDCIGFAVSPNRAFVLPFSTLDNPNLWSFEEELEITLLMLEVLSHKNIRIVGQNFSYDSQYIYKFYLLKTYPKLDTMISNHVLYNYMEKNLAFLASIYVDDYCYWKDDQNHKVGEIK